MNAFSEKTKAAAAHAANLASFPMKGTTYHINAENPDLSIHEIPMRQERFGKMVETTQTVYHLNTKEGKLRLSPNQMQQFNSLFDGMEIDPKQTWLPVVTNERTEATEFRLAPDFDKVVKYTNKSA